MASSPRVQPEDVDPRAAAGVGYEVVDLNNHRLTTADETSRFKGIPMQTEQGWWVPLVVAVVLRAGQHSLGQEVKPRATLKGHSGVILSLAFSPDGRVLASGGGNGTVKLWEVLTGKERATLKGHQGGAYAVVFSPSGRLLASGDINGVVRIWGVGGGRGLVLKEHKHAIYSLAFSPSGRTLAAGGGFQTTGEMRLWDVRAGKHRLPLGGKGVSLNAVSFSSDGRMLAGGDIEGAVTLWEVASGGVRACLRGHRGYIAAVAFVAGGNLLASGGGDGRLRLWDVRAGKERTALEGHTGGIRCVAVGGKLLASSGEDQTVRLWDTATFKQRLVVKLNAPVLCVALSPDGKLLAVGDYRDSIHLWSVPKLLAHKGKK